ncbi:MAG: hypothetical protein QM493_04205 [Sulfurovum sp.]
MNYKTFIGTTTLSIATVFAINADLTNNEISNISLSGETLYTINQNYTYSPTNTFDTTTDIENLMILANFADTLLKNSKPLDNDISQLIDDNIMDLLS